MEQTQRKVTSRYLQSLNKRVGDEQTKCTLGILGTELIPNGVVVSIIPFINHGDTRNNVLNVLADARKSVTRFVFSARNTG